MFLYLGQYDDMALLILRAAVAIIFLVHGLSKWPLWKAQPSPGMSAAMLNIMRLLSIAEPLGAIALLAGFLTQFAALGYAIIMLGAIIMKIRIWRVGFSAKQGGGWEFDFLILASCLALIILGGGAWSLDRLI